MRGKLDKQRYLVISHAKNEALKKFADEVGMLANAHEDGLRVGSSVNFYFPNGRLALEKRGEVPTYSVPYLRNTLKGPSGILYYFSGGTGGTEFGGTWWCRDARYTLPYLKVPYVS